MPTTLAIVDMQQAFAASMNPKTVIAVGKEIEKAKKRNAGIVLIEYKNVGRTHAVFYEMLDGYENVARVLKGKNDGSAQFLRAAMKNGFNTRKVRVCGVNTCYCVSETVTGLLDKGAKVEVIKDACHCNCSARSCWKNLQPYFKHSLQDRTLIFL